MSAKKGRSMKVWFCRDDDGYPTACWCQKIGNDWVVMQFNGNSVHKKFGPGFHGVHKGECKLLDLEVVK